MIFDTIERLMAEAREIIPSDYLRSKRDEGPLNLYYQFFGHLAASIKTPGVFLEIGVQRGGMGAHITTMAPHHVYLGVDRDQVPFSHERAIIVRGDSTSVHTRDAAKAIADQNGGIFCTFLDSSHHYNASVKEWELYSPLLRPGGIFCCDDITPAFFRPGLDAKSMVGFFEELPGEKRLYDDIHHGSVIGIVVP